MYGLFPYIMRRATSRLVLHLKTKRDLIIKDLSRTVNGTVLTLFNRCATKPLSRDLRPADRISVYRFVIDLVKLLR